MATRLIISAAVLLAASIMPVAAAPSLPLPLLLQQASDAAQTRRPNRPRRRPADLPPPKAPGFDPIYAAPPFPSIVNPKAIPASEVTDQVSGSELVLGVVVNGEARAWPINMLTGPRREVINDTLGGRAIAATW